MNKKQIAALIESMVQKLQAADPNMTEDTARTLVGLSIQRNADALLQISVPTLAAEKPAKPAEEEPATAAAA